MLNKLKPTAKAEAISDALDAAVAVIQQRLGQTDGFNASLFFQGDKADQFYSLMVDYIEFEIQSENQNA